MADMNYAAFRTDPVPAELDFTNARVRITVEVAGGAVRIEGRFSAAHVHIAPGAEHSEVALALTGDRSPVSVRVRRPKGHSS